MAAEETLLKLEELRKSSNNVVIKTYIEKIQSKILHNMAEFYKIKLD
ncbi:MAG: hypothetical protein IIC67_07215 [Thaumarchaeota archaeon]|nr:hypothetical protein [Nitrososphaerota archaeon]